MIKCLLNFAQAIKPHLTFVLCFFRFAMNEVKFSVVKGAGAFIGLTAALWSIVANMSRITEWFSGMLLFFFLNLFHFVGRMFLHSFQANIFTLAGTCEFHIFPQIFLSPCTLRTEKIRDFSGCQAIKSYNLFVVSLILDIASTSAGLNMQRIQFRSQPLPSELSRSATERGWYLALNMVTL